MEIIKLLYLNEISELSVADIKTYIKLYFLNLFSYISIVDDGKINNEKFHMIFESVINCVSLDNMYNYQSTYQKIKKYLIFLNSDLYEPIIGKIFRKRTARNIIIIGYKSIVFDMSCSYINSRIWEDIKREDIKKIFYFDKYINLIDMKNVDEKFVIKIKHSKSKDYQQLQTIQFYDENRSMMGIDENIFMELYYK
jgi:hypothetical protein